MTIDFIPASLLSRTACDTKTGSVTSVSTPRKSKSPITRGAAVSLSALMALTGGAAACASVLGDNHEFDAQSNTIIQMADAYGTSVPAVEAAPAKQTNPWLIGGAMALIFGALVKLVGPNRVMNIAAEAGPALQKTAESIAKAPKAAAKAVGSALASSMKLMVLIGGLAMIGFTGISVFDLQWSAGIATGIGMTALTWVGSSRFSKTLKRQTVKVRNVWGGDRGPRS